jgi:hypothetical protein
MPQSQSALRADQLGARSRITERRHWLCHDIQGTSVVRDRNTYDSNAGILWTLDRTTNLATLGSDEGIRRRIDQ